MSMKKARLRERGRALISLEMESAIQLLELPPQELQELQGLPPQELQELQELQEPPRQGPEGSTSRARLPTSPCGPLSRSRND